MYMFHPYLFNPCQHFLVAARARISHAFRAGLLLHACVTYSVFVCRPTGMCDIAQIARGRHKSFIEQLRRIRKPQCISLHIQPSPGTLNKEHGLVVRESLAVAKALSNPPLTVTLRNFNTFGDVVEQLRELPHGETLLLDLKSLFGPAEDAAEGTWPVGQAAALIPASFTTWYVSSKMLRPAELGAFLSNLPKDRTKARPLTVKVTGKSAQWAEQWNASLRQAGTDAFVTVVGEP